MSLRLCINPKIDSRLISIPIKEKASEVYLYVDKGKGSKLVKLPGAWSESYGVFCISLDPFVAVWLEKYLDENQVAYFVTELLDRPESIPDRNFQSLDIGHGVVLTRSDFPFRVLATAPNLASLAKAVENDKRFRSSLFCQGEGGQMRTVMQIAADYYITTSEDSTTSARPPRIDKWGSLIRTIWKNLSRRVSGWWRHQFYPSCSYKR
ncbi:TPA: hypothetical protein DIV45_02020 [Patescibacteria group bacterium]|nr:hypothetical protein [Patescibacteria group bacterium]